LDLDLGLSLDLQVSSLAQTSTIRDFKASLSSVRLNMSSLDAHKPRVTANRTDLGSHQSHVLILTMGKNLMVSLWLATLMCCACSEHTIIMKWPTPKRCRSLVKTVFWISKDRSAVVLGKSDDPIQNCELTFGLESSPKHEKARLRVEYEVFYIHDCGVEVQINESSDSTFLHPDGNHLMIKSNCNTRKPGVLYAQPKNFVRIWWYKKDRLLEAYNFRLNISMIDGLPVVGPAFSTLVIVGLVTFLLVCLAATLFFKYLSHVSQSWHERSVETAMDRAICLYNSQEPLPEEPDHVCLQPGLRG
ncbi:hypothetical protein EGW08_004241, partial [Elysia chlorotica]